MGTSKGISRGKVLMGVLGLVLGGALSVGAAHATIILEGSDAIGLHSRFGDAGAITYRDQVWKAIGGADARPIAFIGDALIGVGSGTHAVSAFSSITAAGALSSYVAVYFQAAGGCCDENDALIAAAADKAKVTSYLGSGGTIMIGNYEGHAAWDFAVGAGGTGNSHVSGVGGGIPGGSTCSDGEKVTATGTTNGFTQPPVIGCWTHQAYDQAGFFAPLGFTLSFFDGGPDYPARFSSLLSNGRTVTGDAAGVPEPTTLALLGLGLLGLGFRRKA